MWWRAVLRRTPSSLSLLGGRGMSTSLNNKLGRVPPPLPPLLRVVEGFNLTPGNATNNLPIADPRKTLIPVGVPKLRVYKEFIIPGANKTVDILEDPLPSLRLPLIEEPLPTGTPTPKKEAARLVVIRRIKMNKHKLRKLRKKMHYKWAKVKERRYIRREKAYLDEKMALIKAAWNFDAKDYVSSVIAKVKEEPIPKKWQDPRMPEWFKEQEMAEERRLKRFQKIVNMYLNKGIKIKVPE